ncbi:MAG: hypothetical protein HRU00_02585 [Myxococcales bacterium]|nr:hypothetical protein [Myxococcales bacterium]
MFVRLLLIVLVGAAAFIMVDLAWDKQTRTLALRIRSGEEIAAVVRSRGVRIADRLAEELREELREELPRAEFPADGLPPPVGAGPPKQAGLRERISADEQGALDSLIDQKTRE